MQNKKSAALEKLRALKAKREMGSPSTTVERAPVHVVAEEKPVTTAMVTPKSERIDRLARFREQRAAKKAAEEVVSTPKSPVEPVVDETPVVEEPVEEAIDHIVEEPSHDIVIPDRIDLDRSKHDDDLTLSALRTEVDDLGKTHFLSDEKLKIERRLLSTIDDKDTQLHSLRTKFNDAVDEHHEELNRMKEDHTRREDELGRTMRSKLLEVEESKQTEAESRIKELKELYEEEIEKLKNQLFEQRSDLQDKLLNRQKELNERWEARCSQLEQELRNTEIRNVREITAMKERESDRVRGLVADKDREVVKEREMSEQKLNNFMERLNTLKDSLNEENMKLRENYRSEIVDLERRNAEMRANALKLLESKFDGLIQRMKDDSLKEVEKYEARLQDVRSNYSGKLLSVREELHQIFLRKEEEIRKDFSLREREMASRYESMLEEVRSRFDSLLSEKDRDIADMKMQSDVNMMKLRQAYEEKRMQEIEELRNKLALEQNLMADRYRTDLAKLQEEFLNHQRLTSEHREAFESERRIHYEAAIEKLRENYLKDIKDLEMATHGMMNELENKINSSSVNSMRERYERELMENLGEKIAAVHQSNMNKLDDERKSHQKKVMDIRNELEQERAQLQDYYFKKKSELDEIVVSKMHEAEIEHQNKISEMEKKFTERKDGQILDMRNTYDELLSKQKLEHDDYVTKLQTEFDSQFAENLQLFKTKEDAMLGTHTDAVKKLHDDYANVIVAKDDALAAAHSAHLVELENAEIQHIMDKKKLEVEHIKADIEARKQFKKQIAAEVEMMRETYAERQQRERDYVHTIESEYQQKINSINRGIIKFESDIKAKYKALMATNLDNCKDVINRRVEKEKEEWAAVEQAKLDMQKKLEAEKLDFESSVRERYTGIMESYKQTEAKTRSEFEDRVWSEVRAKQDEMIEQQRAFLAETRETEKKLREELSTEKETFVTEKEKELIAEKDILDQNLRTKAEDYKKKELELENAKVQLEIELRKKYDAEKDVFMAQQKSRYEQNHQEFLAMMEEKQKAIDEQEREVEDMKLKVRESVLVELRTLLARDRQHTRVLLNNEKSKLDQLKAQLLAEYLEQSRQLELSLQDREMKLKKRYDVQRHELETEFHDKKLALLHDIEDKEDSLRIKEESMMRDAEVDRMRIETQMKEKYETRALDTMKTMRQEHENRMRELKATIDTLNEALLSKDVEILNIKSESERVIEAEVLKRMAIEEEKLDTKFKLRETELQGEHSREMALQKNKHQLELTEISMKLERDSAAKLDTVVSSLRADYDDRISEIRSKHDAELKDVLDEASQNRVAIVENEINIEKKWRNISDEIIATKQAGFEDLIKEVREQVDAEKKALAEQFEKERKDLHDEYLKKEEILHYHQTEYNAQTDSRLNEKMREFKEAHDRVLEEKAKTWQEERDSLHDEYQKKVEANEDEKIAQIAVKEAEFEELYQKRCRDVENGFNKRREEVESKLKAIAAMRSDYEATLRTQTEEQLTAVTEKLDEMRETYEAKISEERTMRLGIEQENNTNVLALKKLEMDFALWKSDYAKQCKSQFSSIIEQLEQKLAKQQEILEERDFDAMERYKTLEIQIKEKEQQIKLRENEDLVRRQEEAMEKQKVEQANAAKARKLSTFKNKMGELWKVLETSEKEQLDFLNAVSSMTEYNEPVLEFYGREVLRLQDQLPLIELITRREFIKYRLREFNKQATDPKRLFVGDSTRLMKEEKQRREFVKELSRLNDQLVSLLPEYESKHSTPLLFKGKPYLEMMHHDIAREEREVSAENATRYRTTDRPANKTTARRRPKSKIRL
ncbi:hypothetical protein PCE1_003128 [Barthelona sp. PCE]